MWRKTTRDGNIKRDGSRVETETEFHCHGRKYKQISQGHFTVQLNDLFYKDRILTGIFYGVLGDEKHSLLLLYYI